MAVRMVRREDEKLRYSSSSGEVRRMEGHCRRKLERFEIIWYGRFSAGQICDESVSRGVADDRIWRCVRARDIGQFFIASKK